MTYLQKSKRGKWTKKISFIVVILVLLILFFFGVEVKGLIHLTNKPISYGKNFLVDPINNFLLYFSSKKNIVDENNDLKEENKKVRLENLTLNILKNENKELKQLLEYSSEENRKVLSKILNKPPFSPFDTFVIDVGNDQVQVGKKVYYQNVLIGEIEEVFSNSSVVRLYSSPDKISIIKIEEKINTEAKGQSAGTFIIEIPKDTEVLEGDVVTSLQDEVIGIVNKIEINESSTFKNVYFSYPIRINSIDWVLIEE